MVKCESVSRTVSSLTLDGRRLVAEVTVVFRRPLAQADADAIGDDAAGAIDSILGEQIVQGQAALEPTQLEGMALARMKPNSRIAALRVLHLRAPVPTLRSGAPAPRPVSSGRPAASVAPPSRPVVAPQGPTPRPPAASPRQYARPPNVTPPPSARVPVAAPALSARPPVVSPAPSARPPVVSPAQSVRPPIVSPAPATTRAVSVPPPERPAGPPASPPSGEVRIDIDVIGASAGKLLRDSAARVIFSALSVVVSRSVDRLAMLEGGAPSVALRRMTAACLAATMYDGLKATGASNRAAAAVVESACKRAAFTDEPSAAEIGHYIANDARIADLSANFASVLGVPEEEHEIRQAIEPHCVALRQRLGAVTYPRDGAAIESTGADPAEGSRRPSKTALY